MFDSRARLHTFSLSLLLLAALTVFLHREVVLGGNVYHMDDAADNYYPARVAFKRAVTREGTLPSWEPGSLCGWPLLADPYYGYFYPLNLVFYLPARAGVPSSDREGLAGGVPAGLGYAASLHMLLGGIGMLMLLRRRTSPLAALYGATAFTLSSFLVVRIRHIIFIQAAAWLPWLLFSIDDYVQTRRRGALVRCGVFTALVLIVGAHSLAHFAALLLLGYAVARLGSAALVVLVIGACGKGAERAQPAPELQQPAGARDDHRKHQRRQRQAQRGGQRARQAGDLPAHHGDEEHVGPGRRLCQRDAVHELRVGEVVVLVHHVAVHVGGQRHRAEIGRAHV